MLVVCSVKGSEVMQMVVSMKSRVEIMAMHNQCMLELVFFKVLSQLDTVHVAHGASKSAYMQVSLGGRGSDG